MTERETECDVLILGAGIAGLVAARALLAGGLRVTVLEARERVGGRLLTEHVSGQDVELGAEFIHGRAQELWALLAEAGLKTSERTGTMLRAESGSGELTEDSPEDGGAFAALDVLTQYTGPDEPFADWLRTRGGTEADRAALTGYVEGFNAADAGVIGVYSLAAQQKAEEATEGDRSWHLHGGYAQLAEYLAGLVRQRGGRILLGKIAKEIDWQPGSATVGCADGSVFSAARCLVSLPLGVLQAARDDEASVDFSPEPPPIEAARRLAMGHVVRFTMVFRSRWWAAARVPGVSPESLAELNFLFTPEEMPPVYWTGSPSDDSAATLTGWAGGPRSAALAGRNADELGSLACQSLAATFDIPEERLRSELIATHTHDWSADPFSRGAYSYVPAGAIDASRAMTEPELGTLYFAGEHTDVTGHWGTVHAAVRSGLRAAEQILSAPTGRVADESRDF